MTPVSSSEPFWTWFQANVESLTMINDLEEAASQQLLADMQQQLDAYVPGLTFEMSAPTPSGRSLTFSAEGDMELFPHVVALVENAPDVDWWEFVAFRQPKGTELKVLFESYRFDTSKMLFMQLECEEEPDILGLRVAFDEKLVSGGKKISQDDEDLQVGLYVTLEALIGEFDCATLVGYLDSCPIPAEPFKAGFRPLDDLPAFVEWFKSQRDKE